MEHVALDWCHVRLMHEPPFLFKGFSNFLFIYFLLLYECFQYIFIKKKGINKNRNKLNNSFR